MNTLKSNLRQQPIAETILDASLNGIFACTAIQNNKGKIIDFEITLINKAFTRILGLSEKEVVGKSYLSVFPSSKSNGMFDLSCEVMEKGKNISRETYYKNAKING